ncbi:MAG: response regulator [Thermomicrobiales bacterium]
MVTLGKPDEKARVVLCVDDDASSLELRRQFLELAGFTVIVAGAPEEGLELFRTHPEVEAAILDYQMPRMNGGELAEAMKRIRPGVPVMIVSSLPWLPEDAPKCIDAFVSKCAPSSDLTTTVAQLVS